MAALLILGALTLKQKVDDRKERKRQKKLHDNERYRELQAASIVGGSKEKSITHQRRESIDSETHSQDGKIETKSAILSPTGHNQTGIGSGSIATQQSLPGAAVRQGFQGTTSGRLIDV